MNENFTKLSRKQFIKMWRTMKAEVGGRMTRLEGSNITIQRTVRQLMDRYEARIVLDPVLNRKKWWRFWR